MDFRAVLRKRTKSDVTQENTEETGNQPKDSNGTSSPSSSPTNKTASNEVQNTDNNRCYSLNNEKEASLTSPHAENPANNTGSQSGRSSSRKIRNASRRGEGSMVSSGSGTPLEKLFEPPSPRVLPPESITISKDEEGVPDDALPTNKKKKLKPLSLSSAITGEEQLDDDLKRSHSASPSPRSKSVHAIISPR